MRRLKSIRVVVLSALAVLACIVAVAEACRHCRQPCVIYIIKEKEGGGGGSQPAKPVDPESHLVRALVIADNNDADDVKYNKDIATDGFQVQSLLASLRTVCKNPLLFDGRDVKKEEILNAIRYEMRVGAQDTLFVYYIGHGEQDKDIKESDLEKGHFFDLFLPRQAPKDTRRLLRSELVAAMKSRSPLLSVLITDTCFFSAKAAADEGLQIRPGSSRFKGVQKQEIQARNVEVMAHLFLNYEGVVDINSCEPQEKAYGDVFTPILVKEMREWAGENMPGWDDFFNVVKKKTEEKSKDVIAEVSSGDKQEKQTPFSFTDLTKVKRLPENWKPSSGTPAEGGTAEGGSTEGGSNPRDGEEASNQPLAAGKTGPALIKLQVPADAKVYLDGTPTQQTTEVRTFQTPDLPGGASFYYMLKAEVSVDGQIAEVTRKIAVQAGKTTPIDLSDMSLYQPATLAVGNTPLATPQVATPQVAEAKK